MRLYIKEFIYENVDGAPLEQRIQVSGEVYSTQKAFQRFVDKYAATGYIQMDNYLGIMTIPQFKILVGELQDIKRLLEYKGSNEFDEVDPNIFGILLKEIITIKDAINNSNRA